MVLLSTAPYSVDVAESMAYIKDIAAKRLKLWEKNPYHIPNDGERDILGAMGEMALRELVGAYPGLEIEEKAGCDIPYFGWRLGSRASKAYKHSIYKPQLLSAVGKDNNLEDYVAMGVVMGTKVFFRGIASKEMILAAPVKMFDNECHVIYQQDLEQMSYLQYLAAHPKVPVEHPDRS